MFAVIEQTSSGPVIQGGFHSSAEADLWGSKNVNGPYSVGPMFLPTAALHRRRSTPVRYSAGAHLPDALLRVLIRRPTGTV
ncbi:hypothetical protein [Frankia canadensis]|uniref:hypothetical protein n=1 Tax=Frankia canadensis TaxID=1836972 RepID=UPI001055215F|nr:hypothetical protein [Frankia canadensis]